MSQPYLGSNGFTQLEMMATLPGVKLYTTLAYKTVSDEIVMLPNNVPLRFVRMMKNLNEHMLVDKILIKPMILSPRPIKDKSPVTSLGLFRESVNDHTDALSLELRSKL